MTMASGCVSGAAPVGPPRPTNHAHTHDSVTSRPRPTNHGHTHDPVTSRPRPTNHAHTHDPATSHPRPRHHTPPAPATKHKARSHEHQAARDHDDQPPGTPEGQATQRDTRHAAMTEVKVEPGDLAYLAEGADHMVVRLRGQGEVLRLRKTDIGKTTNLEGLVERAEKDGMFFKNVARPFLGALLTHESTLVLVNTRALHAFKVTAESKRPERRRKKEINKYGVAWLCPDAASTFSVRTQHPAHTPATQHPDAAATLYPDPAFSRYPDLEATQQTGPESIQHPGPNSTLPTGPNIHIGVNSSQTLPAPDNMCRAKVLCVEIKPKQGFIDRATPSRPICCFCVNQYIKPEKCLDRSQYCPQDLFSGVLARMRKALDSLFQTPQTNLKVFEHGEAVEDIKAYRYLRDVIIAALTHDYSRPVAHLTTAAASLRPGSPLARTLAFQRLDHLGVIRANQVYRRLVTCMGGAEAANAAIHDLRGWKKISTDRVKDSVCREGHDREPNLANGGCDEVDKSNNDIINSYGDLMARMTENKDLSDDRDCLSDEYSSDEQGEVRMIEDLQDFLLATTAKDLSLMVLLEGPHPGPPPTSAAPYTSPFYIDAGESWYKCQVTAVDLIAKPPHKIKKRLQGYRKQLEVLQRLVEDRSEPPCCRS